jgi:V-type H+-transporting ATPase subunit C
VENYLSNFQWNKVKYRADKPIAELLSSLQSEVSSVDSDVKSKFAQYNNTKTNLASMQRSKTGNLSQKSLTSIVNPEWLLKPDASEYLQQHLIAVPAQQVKEFLQTYESLTAMVVPRSASLLAKDDEFHLYAVTVFKKHSAEFLHKCRESRWTPREWKFHEGGKEAEEEELRKLEKEERKVWGEALRLGRTGYSDAVMAWMHVLALRVFVETVLRYGLPLNFVAGIVKVCTLKILRAGTPFVNVAAPVPANTHSLTDRPQARQESKSKPRRPLRRPRRQRPEQRQERQAYKGRRHYATRSGRCRILQRPRLRSLRFLRVRDRVVDFQEDLSLCFIYHKAFSCA